MNVSRVFRLSSLLFHVLLLLLLLLPCEADVISISLSVCNDLPDYVSKQIILVCGYSQGDHYPNSNYKLKVRIHHSLCGSWSINDVAPDRKLVCSVYGDKNITWKTPSFSVREANYKPNPAANDDQLRENGYPGQSVGSNDQNHQEQEHDSRKQEQYRFRFKQDGVYVESNGRDKLVEHWRWEWPSRIDAYIHNTFSDGITWVTVTCRAGSKRNVRRNLRPGGDPLLLKLKMAASVHTGAICRVYWSGISNSNGEIYKFPAFDVARVRDNIYYFHDGLRGILSWHLKEDGLYQWDDERKLEEKVKPWRKKRRRKRNYRGRRFNDRYNGYPYPYP